MKLVSENLVSRSRVVMSPAYWKPVVQVNYGVERRYRHSGWDFFGLFDKRETNWETEWLPVQIIRS